MLTDSGAVRPFGRKPKDDHRQRREEDARQRQDVRREGDLSTDGDREAEDGEVVGSIGRRQALRSHVRHVPLAVGHVLGGEGAHVETLHVELEVEFLGDVRPGGEPHVAVLFVERKVADVDGAGAAEDLMRDVAYVAVRCDDQKVVSDVVARNSAASTRLTSTGEVMADDFLKIL